MIDELAALHRANPTTPERLEEAVAVDRKALIEMLDADAGGPRHLSISRARQNRTATRAGYVGAMAVAAALIVVALLGAEEPTDRDLVEPADDGSPAASVVGDGGAVAEGDQPSEVVVEVAPDLEPETAVPADPTTADLAPEDQVTEDQAAQDASTGEDAASGEDAATGQDTTAPTDSDPVFETAALPAGAPFDPSVDVLSIHLDYFHRDDGHAAVAARELATWFGLTPHVVGGTAASDFDGYVHPFAAVMDTTWGDAWFDARTDRERSLSATVDRWLAAIDAGGQVWVAEGGVSDFTAEVLRVIETRRPEVDTTTAVHVVQHSTSNEEGAVPANLQYVTTNTTYLRIDDGNQENGSADLNQTSDQFTAAAVVGRHGPSWTAAFDYLAADELDFSDTVEVLYILGITVDVVANPDDFAANFIG